MYNEDLKGSFLVTIGGNVQRGIAAQIFDISEAYEKEVGSDLCTFSAEQLKPIVSRAISLRGGVNSTRMKILRSYLHWCLSHGVAGAKNELPLVDIPVFEEFKRRMVSGPAQLQKVFDVYFDSEEMQTIDNMYRCFLWLIFCGAEPQDVPNIKITDVDLAERCFVVGDRRFDLVKEAIQSVKNCVELTEFSYYHPLYSDGKVVLRSRIPCNILVRGIKANPTSERISHILHLKHVESEGTGTPMVTQKTIFTSGLFYRQYEEERAFFGIDGAETTPEHFVSELMLRPSRNTLPRKSITHEARELYNNYIKWKTVFNV